MPRPDAAWFDAQYDNRARIPEHPAIFARWRGEAAAARAGLSCRLDLRYGSGPNETLDLFPSPRNGAPVLVFIHGGYWRALDKADVSFVAPPFVAAGALVVVPNYALCPAVGVDTIALQTARAVAWVHRHAPLYGGDPGRIVVAGHSAGGHLAAMMLACDGRRLGPGLPRRLSSRGLSISGLYDLEPIRRTPFLQADLQLTPALVRRTSPAFFAAPRGATLYSVVGALESEEFLRQNQSIRTRWGSTAVPVCEEVAGRHHLDILDDFVHPAARLHQLALALLRMREP